MKNSIKNKMESHNKLLSSLYRGYRKTILKN